MYLERSPLSALQITQGVSTPHAYKTRDVILAQLDGTIQLVDEAVRTPESLVDLITFGDAEVTTVFIWCLIRLR